MSRVFTSPFPTFYKADGVTVNSSGKLYFYEPGAGTTLKSIYSDKALSITLTNPVILSLVGQLESDIYLNGNYKVKLTDSAGTTIDEVENYEPADLGFQFSDWDSTKTYSQYDFTRATNGKYYQSLGSGNISNEPSVSASSWEEIYFVGIYNANKIYAADDIVKYGGSIYVSLQGSNTGNTPDTTASAYWRSFFEPSIVTDYTASGFEYRNSDGYNTTIFDVDSNIADSAFESIGPTGSGADNIWTAMNAIPDEAKMVIVSLNVVTSRSGTTNDTLQFFASARQTGGSASSGFSDVCGAQTYGGAASNDAYIRERVEFTVPIDSSKRFDFLYDSNNSTGSDSINLYLVGYKI